MLIKAVFIVSLATAPLTGVASRPTGTGLHVAQPEHRSEDQTFLTFPEWFLVFSPTEYAELLRTRSSSEFPWFGHIGQFWSAYHRVIDATRGYPFNGEYHTMIVVIGVSTTLEYAIKGGYETLIGRLSELTSAPNATPEDRLAARIAQEYVDFIRIRPWYEFDFVAPLRQLWAQPAWGENMLRKWERRYLLTSEWTVKAGYAWLLQQATHSTFATPSTETHVVVRGLSADIDAAAFGLRRIRTSGNDTLVALPRYQGFTYAALALARQGVQFVEIAGNRGSILVSVVAPIATPKPSTTRVLFRQPIMTRPGHERRVLVTTVHRLNALLAGPQSSDAVVEHVFDY